MLTNRDSDYFDEFEEPTDDIEFQPHITDDPNVWGLYDVARGRTTEVPVTIYLISGDNASGVMGLLFPNGDFMCRTSSRKGLTVVLQDGGADDGQELNGRTLPTGHTVNATLPTKFEMTVAWDGSTKSPELTVIDDGEVFITNEHSRGLILGDYSRSYQNQGRKNHQDFISADPFGPAHSHQRRDMREPEHQENRNCYPAFREAA